MALEQPFQLVFKKNYYAASKEERPILLFTPRSFLALVHAEKAPEPLTGTIVGPNPGKGD